MTPHADWTPLPETVDYIARWYAWATSGAPDGEGFERFAGLCYEANTEVFGDLLEAFGCKAYPFGKTEYEKHRIKDAQHECPNRLAFCRAVLVRAGRIMETADDPRI